MNGVTLKIALRHMGTSFHDSGQFHCLGKKSVHIKEHIVHELLSTVIDVSIQIFVKIDLCGLLIQNNWVRDRLDETLASVTPEDKHN